MDFAVYESWSNIFIIAQPSYVDHLYLMRPEADQTGSGNISRNKNYRYFHLKACNYLRLTAVERPEKTGNHKCLKTLSIS